MKPKSGKSGQKTEKHLFVIPDANVLMHGKSLSELPWGELDADVIDVLLVGPVINDLDGVKNRPGRPGKLARAISSSVRDMIRSGEPVVIRPSGPRVTRSLWMGFEVTEPVRSDIDIAHADQAIINIGLWRIAQGDRVVLLTDDNYATLMAQRYGMPVQLMPDHWRRENEPDETQKELARERAENARLRKAEPELAAWFEDQDGIRISQIDVAMPLHRSLSSDLVDALMQRVERAAPCAKVTPTSPSIAPKPEGSPKSFDISALSAGLSEALWNQYDPVTPQQIENYKKEYQDWLQGVRQHLVALHADHDRERQWPLVRFFAHNAGSRPASEVLIEIESSGGLFIERPPKKTKQIETLDAGRKRKLGKIPAPPKPPKPGSRLLSAIQGNGDLIDRLGLGRSADHLGAPYIPNLRREADSFYWREGRHDRVQLMELECELFRHQREPHPFPISLFASGTEERRIKGVITGTVNASNISQPIMVQLPVSVRFEGREVAAIAETMVGLFEQELLSGGS